MKKCKVKKLFSSFLGLLLSLALLVSFFPLISLGQEESSQDQELEELTHEDELISEEAPSEEEDLVDEDISETPMEEEPQPEPLEEESFEPVEEIEDEEDIEKEIKLIYMGLILTGQDLEIERLKPSLEEIGAYMKGLEDWDYKFMSLFALKGEGYLDFSKEGQEKRDIYKLEGGEAELLLDSRLTSGNYLLAQDLIEVDEEILLKPGEDLNLVLVEGCWRLEGDQILEARDDGYKALEVGQARLVSFSLEDELLTFKARDILVEKDLEEEDADLEEAEEEDIKEEPEEKPNVLEEESLENESNIAPPIEIPEEEIEEVEEIKPEPEPPEDYQAGDDDLYESLPDEDTKGGELGDELLMAQIQAMPLCHNLKLSVKTYIAGNYGSLARVFDYSLKIGKAPAYCFSLGHGDYRDFSFKKGERVILEVLNPQPYQVTVRLSGRELKGKNGLYILEDICEDSLLEITNSYYVSLDMGLSQEEGLLILSLGLIFLVIAFLGWRRWVYWIKV